MKFIEKYKSEYITQLIIFKEFVFTKDNKNPNYWFTMFGYGIRWNKSLTFSERRGLRKYITILGWYVRFIKTINS